MLVLMFEQGRPLSNLEHTLYQPYYLPRTLLNVRIVEGHVPFWLSKNMCAVVLGHRIYFRTGVYQANTARGVELLAHELTHVEQYLAGMNVFKYVWASRNGYMQNPYEIEAYAKGAYVCEQILMTRHPYGTV